MMKDVRDFFDEHTDEYHDLPDSGYRRFHTITAGRIERAISGRILSVGGLWSQAEVDAERIALTVADVSSAMLRRWQSQEIRSVLCDARDIPFAEASFDHLVFPLVLHHIADGSARRARANVARAVDQAYRVLGDGGTLWISEFSLPWAVYSLQHVLAPATRLVLSAAGIPMPIMHTADFYVRVLSERGFDPTVHRIHAEDARASDLIRPVIGLPWLRVPRMLYPLRTVLIEATKT